MAGLVLMAQAATAAPAVSPAASAVAAPQEAPVTLRIVQAQAAAPRVAVYLDVRTESGAAAANLNARQLRAEIGAHPARAVSLQAFAASGEGVAYIFLVDVSKSLKAEQFAQIRAALTRWTDQATGKNRFAIVSFGETVKTVQDFTADKALLKTRIGELAPADLHTRLYDGLLRALDLGRRADAELPRRRVILTLTDGVADAAGGATREEVMARVREEPVPVYAIGYAAASVSARDRDAGFKALGAFAHASGGIFTAAGVMPFDEIFGGLHRAIGEAYLLDLECAACPGDGRAYPLRVWLEAGNRVLTASTEVRMTPGVAPPPAPPAASAVPETAVVVEDALPAWVLPVVGGSVIALLLLAWSRRIKPVAPVPQTPEPVQAAASGPMPAPTVAPNTVTAATATPLPGIAVQFTVVSGMQRGRTWSATVVGREALIGRAAGCAVRIDDDVEVSSRNSALSAEGGLVFVADLDSTNGTAVNGTPISGRTRLEDGDLIRVGRTEMRLSLPGKPG